jgi:hypothetical protein
LVDVQAKMDPSTRQFVQRRAKHCCEYCLLPQEATPFVSFHVEHIRARQHSGSDSPDNLALACDRCNAFKGPNLVSVDPDTGAVVPLFDPRAYEWSQHFRFREGRVIGITPTGRATVRLLNMNAPRRVQLREIHQDADRQLE